VVPVWNRPVETRNCLVSLVEHTPDSRLILVDNCSDRDTERMLEEFAEALDVRVLLLRTTVNEGFVKAVNRGVARSETPLVAVVRHNSRVMPGWLEPLLAFADEEPSAGIVVPGFVDAGPRRRVSNGSPVVRGMELPAADFAALMMRHSLFEQIGGFNEELDGGEWCLKEFSRRACRAGFRTCAVPEGMVCRVEDVQFGSLSRRAEHQKSISSQFVAQWGTECSFCLHLPRESDLSAFMVTFPVIIAAARQGHRITILAHARVARDLLREGVHHRHRHVEVVALPALMPARTVRQVLEGFAVPPTLVEVQKGTPCPGFTATMDFAEFTQMVRATESAVYGRRLESAPSPICPAGSGEPGRNA